MIVRNLTEKDIDSMCKIHAATFDSSHFSSVFPKQMLYDYYRLFLKHNDICLGVETDDHKLAGYTISGTGYKKAVTELRELYKKQIPVLVLKHPRFILEKLLDIYHEIIKKNGEEYYIIDIIAVDPSQKRKGVGHLLLQKVEEILTKKGIKKYGSYIRKKNVESIKFHENNQFKIIYENYKYVSLIKNINN